MNSAAPSNNEIRSLGVIYAHMGHARFQYKMYTDKPNNPFTRPGKYLHKTYAVKIQEKSDLNKVERARL